VDDCRKIVCAALALASLTGTASADESAPSGREVTNPAELESLLDYLESLR